MQTDIIQESGGDNTKLGVTPMDQLPGPPGVPLLGNVLQINIKKLHRTIENWSNEYGTIFKIKLGAIPVVVITAPEAIQYVLKNRPDKFRRMNKMDTVIREMGVQGVFNAEGKDWKRQRRLVSQALNIQHLKSFFPVLADITAILLRYWTNLSAQGASVDVKGELMRYTVDVTAQLAFGHTMNTIEKKENVIQQHLEIIFPAIFRRMNAPIPYWRFVKLPADKKLDKSLKVVNKAMQDVIDKTRDELKQPGAAGNQPSNFLQALLASDPDDPISNQEVIGNVLTMLLAGEDTTAHTLTWIIYFMHVFPGVQQKMQQEADLVLADENVLKNYDDVQRLRYMEAVAFEAMRLKPVSPTLFHDALEDVVIAGVAIPKGTGIFLQTHLAAISEEHFSDAGKFIPERWMEGGCPAGNTHNQKAYFPFGAGPRFCPGYQLAMLEIKTVLAMVCKNFEVRMETNPDTVDEVLTFTMKPSDFFIKLTKRKKSGQPPSS